MISIRILVVEDDPISQRILTNYLGKWGYDFTVATDGEAAWQLLQETDYPVVISDWMLPRLNGIDLVRRIRESPSRHGHIYTLLLTGKTAKEDMVAAMDAGADDFVSKPFDRDELRVRLREGVKMVTWDREIHQQTSGLVGQLKALQTLLASGLNASPEAAQQVLHESQSALMSAYDAAEQLGRTLRPGSA